MFLGIEPRAAADLPVEAGMAARLSSRRVRAFFSNPMAEALGPGPVDRFIPNPDVRERHETIVRAPAALVFETARNFDLGSVPLVRAIFWLRAAVLGAKKSATDWSRGFVDEALGMGWGLLAEEKGRLFVAGAQCQPWRADVVFTPIPPEGFAAFAQPDRVKIAWTLEAEPIDAALTRLSTETRAVATDAAARTRFLRYWRVFGVGIVGIRLMLLQAIRREAERRWRASGTSGASNS